MKFTNKKAYGLIAGVWIVIAVVIQVLFPEGVTNLGFYGASLFEGDIYKLLLFPFVHSSFLHLVENMLAIGILILLAIDIDFEPKDFLLISLGSTYVIALLASWVYPYTIIVGSSVGVFALFGAMAIKGHKIIPMYHSFGAFAILLAISAASSWYGSGSIAQDVYHSLGLLIGAGAFTLKEHY